MSNQENQVITHSCGCTSKKPCPRAWGHFHSGDRELLAKHLERTMLIDGIPIVVYLRSRPRPTERRAP